MKQTALIYRNNFWNRINDNRKQQSRQDRGKLQNARVMQPVKHPELAQG